MERKVTKQLVKEFATKNSNKCFHADYKGKLLVVGRLGMGA